MVLLKMKYRRIFENFYDWYLCKINRPWVGGVGLGCSHCGEKHGTPANKIRYD